MVISKQLTEYKTQSLGWKIQVTLAMSTWLVPLKMDHSGTLRSSLMH